MKRTCSLPDCDKPHRARGLCVTHYNQKNPRRHVKVTQQCAWCDTEVFKMPRSNAVFGVSCSSECRGYLLALAKRGGVRSECTEVVAVERSLRTDMRPRPAGSQRLRWFAGKCWTCEAPFVSPHFEMTCGDECAEYRFRAVKSEHKHRRRARLRDAHVAAVNRQAIFRRDDWICWICKKHVDQLAGPQSDAAPSLDHVIPLANGGTHEPSNVRTAHRGCNSRRSNLPTVINRAGVEVAVLF